ncbi:MAG TPA: type II secretion system F family protein [Sphingomicrobium sp.]
MLEFISDNMALRLAALLLLFVIAAAGAYAAMTSGELREAARRRLAGAETGDVDLKQAAGSLRSQTVESRWLRLVNAIEKSGLPLTDTKDDKLRQKLASAGYFAAHAPRVFTLVRLVLVIGLPLLMLGLLWLTDSTPGLMGLYVWLAGAATIGLYGPALFVRIRANRRRQAIVNAFPDALDLLLVCVEAGLGLEAAFARVGMEMTSSHPLLAEQFGSVVLELRAGRSREDALRRMADRAGADEIRSFATLLIQSSKLGSSIAQTLRVYASEMREKRRMRAEEKAHRLPVLLSIPLVVCMLPVMIGVLMLPAAIRVIRSLMPAMTGGGG